MKNIHILPTDKPSRLVKQKYDTIDRLCLADMATKRAEYKRFNIHITSDEEIKEGDWYITPNNTVLKALGSMLINAEDYKKIILTTDQDLIKDSVQAIDDEFLEWFVKNPSCEEVDTSKIKTRFRDEWRFEYKIIIPKEEPKQETIKIACVQCCGTGEIQKSTNRKQSNFECDLCNGKGYWNKVIEPKQESFVERMKPLQEQWQQDMYKELMKKETTLEEAAERYAEIYRCPATNDNEYCRHDIISAINFGIKLQQEKSYSEEEVLNFTQTMLMQYKFGNTNIEQMDLLRETFQLFKNK